MRSFVIIILSLAISSPLFAGDITECSNFQIPVNYHANNFKLKHERDSKWGDKYFYLIDSINFRQSDEGQNLFIKGSIALILQPGNVATVEYQEAVWKKLSDVEFQFVEELSYSKFETTWSSKADRFEVANVGNGQSATCYESGYDAYFTFTKNLGAESLSGLKKILHYGYSNSNPLE